MLDFDLGVSVEVSGGGLLHPGDPLLLEPHGHSGGSHGQVQRLHRMRRDFSPLKKMVESYQSHDYDA